MENLKELYDYIDAKVAQEEISGAVGLYAVGWILYDLFEWLDLQKERNPDLPLSPGLIDQWVREQPNTKIDREIENAEQNFGQAAVLATEEETQRRMTEAVNNSILAQVKQFTSGWKAFGLNILAGIVAGLIFSALAIYLYVYVLIDPSINARFRSYFPPQQQAPEQTTKP
jgi:hypothetical protein